MDEEIISRIRELQAEWLRLQPLKKEDEERLWFKLRLEWNYNSNHIEGNTLTYGETQLLFLHGQTVGTHTLREYEEMKGHDVAIAQVRDLAVQSRDLSEVDIRNLNQLVLVEPFWKEAITPGGEPTRKRLLPGEYKSAPNNVRTPTGELFEFAPPIGVPMRMAALVQSSRAAMADEATDVIKFAAKLHHDFVIIHPFDDGNGRVGRLLMNYVLLRKGYLPIIIKSETKKEYYLALQRADVGDLSALEDILARGLVASLELAIRLTKGETG